MRIKSEDIWRNKSSIFSEYDDTKFKANEKLIQVQISHKNTPVISPWGLNSAWNLSVDFNDLYSSSLDPKRLARLRTILGSE